VDPNVWWRSIGVNMMYGIRSLVDVLLVQLYKRSRDHKPRQSDVVDSPLSRSLSIASWDIIKGGANTIRLYRVVKIIKYQMNSVLEKVHS
jgi:hypothetical protein